MQIIFQDPYGSLNPRMTVGDAIAEAYVIHGIGDRVIARSARCSRCWIWSACRARPPQRYPHEFSGGQRQRVGIARALALKPEFRRLRRGGVGSRCLRSGPDHQSAAGSAARAEAHLPVHLAQSVGRASHLATGSR